MKRLEEQDTEHLLCAGGCLQPPGPPSLCFHPEPSSLPQTGARQTASLLKARTWAPAVCWPLRSGGKGQWEKQGQQKGEKGPADGLGGSAPLAVPQQRHVAPDPRLVGRDLGVHPREAGLGTASAEAHHCCLHPLPVPELADQGAPRVALEETRKQTGRGQGAVLCHRGSPHTRRGCLQHQLAGEEVGGEAQGEPSGPR